MDIRSENDKKSGYEVQMEAEERAEMEAEQRFVMEKLGIPRK